MIHLAVAVRAITGACGIFFCANLREMKRSSSSLFSVVLVIVAVIVILLLVNFQRIRQRQLRCMALDVFTAFNACRVYYWADFGTLLGIVRERDIILDDNDIDICVERNSETIRKLEQCVRPRLEELGYTLAWHSRSIYRIYRFWRGFVGFVDVYMTERRGDIIIGATGTTSNIPAALVGTPVALTWKDVQVMVPARVHETLEWRYGPTYMTPQPGYKGRAGIHS